MTSLRFMRSALASLVLACAPALAQAAGTDDTGAFAKFLSDPGTQQAMQRAASKATVMVNNPCPDATYAPAGKLTVYLQPSFDAPGKIKTGAWAQGFDEKGCGAQHALKVFAFVKEDKAVVVVPLLSGTTLADPLVQKDAVYYALNMTNKLNPDCKKPYVQDTTFLQRDEAFIPAGMKTGPWSERWTVISCSKTMSVPMKFMPDPKGMKILAGPENAVRIQGAEIRVPPLPPLEKKTQ